MNSDEQRDLHRLVNWLERIEPWQKLTGEDSGGWAVDPRSALAGDDAKTHSRADVAGGLRPFHDGAHEGG
ncbi:MAG TPA: hypothetical protein VFV66_02160 [Nonomuraea sp.]|nr:hypothetical protein [Nonomuraea sp.]